jgi:hypothetical protein
VHCSSHRCSCWFHVSRMVGPARDTFLFKVVEAGEGIHRRRYLKQPKVSLMRETRGVTRAVERRADKRWQRFAFVYARSLGIQRGKNGRFSGLIINQKLPKREFLLCQIFVQLGIVYSPASFSQPFPLAQFRKRSHETISCMMVETTSNRLINTLHGCYRYQCFSKKDAQVMRLLPSPIQQKLAMAQSVLS